MRVYPSIVGRVVSFLYPDADNSMILINGLVTKYLGDGLIIGGHSYWFADMVALRKHQRGAPEKIKTTNCNCPGVACPEHGLPSGSSSGGW